MTQRNTQLPAVTRSASLAELLSCWHRGSDHPFKLRMIRLVEKLLGPGRLVAQTTSGFRFSVDHADLIQRTVLQTGSWETEETEFFNGELRPEDVFYDIGANVGYFTCVALSAGVRQVVAFDPDPLNLEVLRLNLRLNQFPESRWTLVNGGLGDRTETKTFHRAHVANTGVSGFENGASVDAFSVKVWSLDEYLQGSAASPTVLKIDVEGWEQFVFAGAERLLISKPPRLILFETACDSAGVMTNHVIREQLERAGYTIRRLSQEPPEDPTDNFVATLEKRP